MSDLMSVLIVLGDQIVSRRSPVRCGPGWSDHPSIDSVLCRVDYRCQNLREKIVMAHILLVKNRDMSQSYKI